MNEISQLASEITQRFGVIKRARGCYIYTAKGVRLTDLYQEHGRAILGWGGGSAFTVLKNVLSRGITGSYDTDFTPRAGGSAKSQLSRAVSTLLASERVVYVYSSRNAALKAALSLFPENTSFYRPWALDTDWRSVGAVVIEPPLPWTSFMWIVAVRPEAPELQEPAGERFSAPLCAAVTRALYDMVKALQERSEKDWFIYDTVLTRYWTRKGPYLYPKIAESRYPDFVLHCLEQGLIISPEYNQPSIVPFGADRGVFRKLEAHPFTV
ncbi:MAG: hypothetical protein K6G80_08620 [Treponema sp.]|nr:hypothetical protein [Treponema sp.]